MAEISVGWRAVREGGLRLDEVEDALGLDVQTSGDEDWAICPLPTHGGDRSGAHFSINTDTFKWKCFTCGAGGALPLLVQKCLGMDRAQAINWLAQYSDVDANAPMENWVRKFRGLTEINPKTAYAGPPTLPWFPDRMIEEYEANLGDGLEFIRDKWGITPETACEFRLGYAENYNWKSKLLGAAVIVPHFWRGNLVGWQARWTSPPAYWSGEGYATKFPKYVNTDSFPKQYTLYGWDKRQTTGGLIVVESFATVMKLHQCGRSAVATFGATISEHQQDILATHHGPLLLAYDNDAAGEGAQRGLVDALRARGNVWVVPPPEQEKGDLGDLTEPQIDALLDQAKPFYLAHNR
jgi:hypothetical protein